MEAAAYSIDTFNQAQAWNKALLDNGARPSGAMVMTAKDGAPAELTDEQFARLRAQIDEQYAGASKVGRPMLFEGGLEWREMSINPKDMDHLNGLWANARLIALTHDVPPQLLGIPGDSTFANFEQAQLSFWENTVLPELDGVLEYLNAWLVPQFGEGMALPYDEDSIRALEPRRQVMFDRAAKATWLKVNEKRVMTGFDEIGPEGDVVLTATGQIPLEAVGTDLNETELVQAGFSTDEEEKRTNNRKHLIDGQTLNAERSSLYFVSTFKRPPHSVRKPASAITGPFSCSTARATRTCTVLNTHITMHIMSIVNIEGVSRVIRGASTPLRINATNTSSQAMSCIMVRPVLNNIFARNHGAIVTITKKGLQTTQISEKLEWALTLQTPFVEAIA